MSTIAAVTAILKLILYQIQNLKKGAMRKYIIIVVTGVAFLSPGCSLSRYFSDKTPIELEQYENPMIWKEVFQMQVSQWPLEKTLSKVERTVNELEKTVNEMRDELAKTRLSSIQANYSIESLQAEIRQIKSESIRNEKTSVELPIEKKDKKDVRKMGTVRIEGKSKKADSDIQSIVITDIRYYKVSDTRDKVLIYIKAVNHPKFQTLIGGNPRIVLDFFNTRYISKEKYEIITDGNFIKRIRLRSYTKPMQKVRVVFDMMQNKKYSVDRIFLKKENIYSVDIKSK